jgi:hypothetical protein
MGENVVTGVFVGQEVKVVLDASRTECKTKECLTGVRVSILL